MKTIEFTAYGTPKAQPRAKACIRGKHAGVYDPGTADDWKSIVRNAALEAWDGKPLIGPLYVQIDAWLPRPKSHFTKKGLRENAPSWVESKPDLDNLEKAILDALTNLGLWRDDSQVARVAKRKRYTAERPYAWVKIEEICE